MIEKSKKVWTRGNPSNPKDIITTLQSYGGWYDGSFDDSLSISGMVFYIDHNSKITMINPIRVEAQCIMECYQEIKLFCDGDILQDPDGRTFIFDGDRIHPCPQLRRNIWASGLEVKDVVLEDLD